MKQFRLPHNNTSESVLRESEKRAIRESLMQYMERTPIRSEMLAGAVAPVVGFWPRWGMASLILLIIFAIAGVVFAAERSLPGKPLYMIKTAVDERMMEAFSFTINQKARTELAIAGRRLDEAEKLNDNSDLSTSTRDALNADFNKHDQAFNIYLNKLSKYNTDEGVQVAQKYKEMLRSHQKGYVTLTGTAI